MPSRRLFAAALFASLTLFSLPASASATTQYRGVMVHSLWYDSSNADMDRELDLIRDSGSNLVRVDVSWANLEENGKGQFTQWYLQKLDRFVAGAGARGLKVLPTLFQTPCWASSAPDSQKQGCSAGWWQRDVVAYPPSSAGDYADIARWMTSRYGTKLAALEIWNEPNLSTGQFLKAPDKAAAYADLLKAAYPAAKAGNPDVPVLAGSLSGADLPFLTALYAQGIRGSYDGIAVHPYDELHFAQMVALHAAQTAVGDHAPLWVTEFGWPTGTSTQWHVSESDQATAIIQGFADLARLDYVQGAALYTLRDAGENPSDMESNFGVVRRDFTPKPGYAALTQAMGGAGSAKHPASTRLRLFVARRAGAVYAHGTAPARRTVSLRLTRCRHAAPRRLRIRSSAAGRFSRRLGPTARVSGCRIKAALA